jgi:hypothetical protein
MYNPEIFRCGVELKILMKLDTHGGELNSDRLKFGLRPVFLCQYSYFNSKVIIITGKAWQHLLYWVSGIISLGVVLLTINYGIVSERYYG